MSYRTEGYGLLAVLRFLFHDLAKYTGAFLDLWQGILATDSLSVLNTLAGKGSTYGEEDDNDESLPRAPGDQFGTDKYVETDIILDILRADWDVLIEIQETLKLFPEMELKFVRGHQDCKKPYAALKLLAQLNIDADKKAEQYQETFGSNRPIAHLMQNSGVLFDMAGKGTITCHMQQEIRHAYGGRPLIQYLQERYL